MPVNQGILVIAPIRPNDSSDTYPTAHANELLGGLHSVANNAERDAIPADRRAAGMLVSVMDTSTIYQLQSDQLTWVKLNLYNSESQTGRIDGINGVPYLLIPKAREVRRIVTARLHLHSGSCTAQIKINNVLVSSFTNMALSTTPLERVAYANTSDNIVPINGVVSLEISGFETAESLFFQVDYRFD